MPEKIDLFSLRWNRLLVEGSQDGTGCLLKAASIPQLAESVGQANGASHADDLLKFPQFLATLGQMQ